MIDALIIDDKARNRKTLELLLQDNFPELNIVGHAEDVKSGLEKISTLNPQIVFLDIEMPDGSGFDLLRRVSNYTFETIFTTAHDEYALEAFKFSAIGYLLKPISEEELRVVVQKTIELLQNRQPERRERVTALMENYESRIDGKEKMNKLVVPEADGYRVLKIDEIIYLQGDGNYTYLFMTDKTSLHSSHNLGWFEINLINQKFYRISKSNIINLAHVTLYSHKDGGNVVMSDNTPLSVSDNKKEELRNRFL